MTSIKTARTYLFVPASRPERFAKAHASGADVVILDLEDAVADGDKDRAREALFDYLAAGGRGMVRVNGTRTSWFKDDAHLCRMDGVQGVILPKTEQGADIQWIRQHLRPDTPVLPLIETAAGMINVREIAGTHGVARLVFGTVDFRKELGIEGDDQELLFFRSMLVLASKAAGIDAPVDGVTLSISDTAELRRASEQGRRLGFGGKLCIHPSQVPEVNAAYQPSDALLNWARRVLEAAQSRPGAFQLDGAMVDAPVIAHATALLRQAAQSQP
ncbi:HpcH/HpaI aldolase/citrate lyase family protein [Cupriavidus sp. TMH.W2]|uniref:HpcH/HpaI aldolase/citrate lyase family protein n=1 Tax=Cupriavidus sp. TMH.W2 TaxID=3434465 RepID=UPI003D76AF76